MDIKNIIAEYIEKSLSVTLEGTETSLDRNTIAGLVAVPPDEKMGDFAFPCFYPPNSV